MRLVHCRRQGCRLETLFAGRWGTVCGRGFAAASAGVLCRAFGYPHGAARADFGGGQSAPPTVWLADVQCKGGEGDVGDCLHAPWGEVAGCGHSEDVGLCCFGAWTGARGVRRGPSDWPQCPPAAAPFARLSDCDYRRCRLEIEHDGEWGAVCAAGFDEDAAHVVCASLGFPAAASAGRGAGAAATAHPARPAPSRAGGRVWLSLVRCSGSETNVSPLLPPLPVLAFSLSVQLMLLHVRYHVGVLAAPFLLGCIIHAVPGRCPFCADSCCPHFRLCDHCRSTGAPTRLGGPATAAARSQVFAAQERGGLHPRRGVPALLLGALAAPTQ